MNKWQLQEAKNKLSHLIEVAMSGNPQMITKRGEDAVVLLGIKDYIKLQGTKKSFKKLLLEGVKVDDLEITRSKSGNRELEL